MEKRKGRVGITAVMSITKVMALRVGTVSCRVCAVFCTVRTGDSGNPHKIGVTVVRDRCKHCYIVTG